MSCRENPRIAQRKKLEESREGLLCASLFAEFHLLYSTPAPAPGAVSKYRPLSREGRCLSHALEP